MKNLNRNCIKVLFGFFAGLILLFFIHELNYVIIALIQTIFFIGFYTCVDKVLDYFPIRITSIFNLKGRIRAFLHRNQLLRHCFEDCENNQEDLCTLDFEGINQWFCNKKLSEEEDIED